MKFHIFRRRKPKAEPVRYESGWYEPTASWDVVRLGEGQHYEREMCTCIFDACGRTREANARLIADALNEKGR